jgi:hypothetical protein
VTRERWTRANRPFPTYYRAQAPPPEMHLEI